MRIVSLILTQRRRLGNWTRPRNWSPQSYSSLTLVVAGRHYSMVHRRGWGIYCISVTVAGEQTYQRDDVRDWGMLALIKKKPSQKAQPDVQHFAPLESKLLTKHTGLLEHCAVVRYADGDIRETGNIMISTSGPSWVVTINDRDSGKRLRVLAATIDAALSQANVLVQEEDAPWEDAPWLLEGSKKKRK